MLQQTVSFIRTYSSDVLTAVIGPVPKEKPGILRPTITDEIIRRNGGKIPQEMKVKRSLEGYDSDTAGSVNSVGSSNAGNRVEESGRKPFSVDEWVEDTFKTTTTAFGATKIPANDVLFVANYMEYSKLEAALEQPVIITFIKFCCSIS